MKLNKVKVARLTDDQAKGVQGGGTADSTRRNFTCCWCTGGGDTDGLNTCSCATVNPNDNTCQVNTSPVHPGTKQLTP